MDTNTKLGPAIKAEVSLSLPQHDREISESWKHLEGNKASAPVSQGKVYRIIHSTVWHCLVASIKKLSRHEAQL